MRCTGAGSAFPGHPDQLVAGKAEVTDHVLHIGVLLFQGPGRTQTTIDGYFEMLQPTGGQSVLGFGSILARRQPSFPFPLPFGVLHAALNVGHRLTMADGKLLAWMRILPEADDFLVAAALLE